MRGPLRSERVAPSEGGAMRGGIAGALAGGPGAGGRAGRRVPPRPPAAPGRWIAGALAGGRAGGGSAAERIPLDRLPAPVREAALIAGDGEVEWVERQDVPGEEVYAARVGPEGRRRPLRFADDGTRLPRDKAETLEEAATATHAAPPPGPLPAASLDQAPTPAREAIAREAGGRAVRGVSRVPGEGGTRWIVELDDGRVLETTGDGAIVRR